MRLNERHYTARVTHEQLDRPANEEESRPTPLESFTPFAPNLAPNVPLAAPHNCESVSQDLATWCRVRSEEGGSEGWRPTRHGPSVTFHPNGRLASHGRYAGGEWSGRWWFFRSDGSMDRAASYLNGREDGLQVHFHRNGKRASECTFTDGAKHGVEKLWTESGELMSRTEWAHGQHLRTTVYTYKVTPLAEEAARENMNTLEEVSKLQGEHVSLVRENRFDEAEAIAARIDELLATLHVSG